MALALPSEVAHFLDFVPLPAVPIVPAFITHTIVKVPSDQAPWFIYERRERSEDLIAAARIVLQSNFFQVQR
jgi:hypothetical protein